VLRILAYHRVSTPDADLSLNPRLISATPESFAAQMRYVARRYTPVHPSQVLEAAAGGPPLPSDAVLVTFDDGYRDFGEAWQIMKHEGIPAIVFVATSYPDRHENAYWWDRLCRAMLHVGGPQIEISPLGVFNVATLEQKRAATAALHAHALTLGEQSRREWVDHVCQLASSPSRAEENGILTWSEIRRLASEGVVFAPHTRTHPDLTQVDDRTLSEEVAGSYLDLEKHLGSIAPVFCYPGGRFDARVERAVHDAGYKLALTTRDGFNSIPGESLRMRRTSITLRTTMPVFILRLTEAVSYLDRFRHRKLHSHIEAA
jgi:peptidoglycan/xylan/chitin deacetylase (PgdA/CDA1 family)